MKKRRTVSFLLLSALVFCSVLAFFYGLDRSCPQIPSGASMPSDIRERSYPLCGFEPVEGGYRFVLRDLEADSLRGLSFIFGDVADFSLFCNEKHIYTYNSQDDYKRLIQVELDAAAVDEKGDAVFFLETLSPYVFEGAFPASLVVFKPKLLLGESGRMAEFCTLSFSFIMLELGVFALMSFTSLVLYRGKRSEKYLLLLAFMSGCLFLASLLNLNSPLQVISQGLYTRIRPFLHMFPMVANASICFYLMKEAIPLRFRCIFDFKNITILTLTALGIQALAPNWANLIIPLRLFLLFPVVLVLCFAYKKGQRGALLLMFGYVSSEAMANFMLVLQNLNAQGLSPIRTFGRISQLGHMLYLLTCMLVIMDRFSSKFREADDLVIVLDKRVEERTAQLENEQATKHKMMTNIFHDLRSPIFAMQGYVSMLETNAESLPLALPVLKERLSFLEKLIENLFLMAKLEERAITFSMEDVELSGLCRRLLEASRIEAQKKQIELGAALPEEALVCGEAFHLSRAIQEVLENAILYTPEQGKVEFLLFQTEDEKSWELQIRDNGNGIPEADLPFVFDRYYRSSRADHKRSSGLGLSIAREIIAMHNGEIGVESREGEGTCFTIRLPGAE